ncbi:Brix domain-containing protein [Spironucleus salmonicida]|uniref:Brix domain-containing protein n=1 Tax=Spironucleus salmonicida TaxID=348837 RepID=V6LQV8_9EUKA|nr:Brix domain-containing protein [Spironucleus salmonicida]|eukprot:EST46970.1 Brix domain-containing protein [Spironucleus salmonicida]
MNTLIYNRTSIPPAAFELKAHLNELLYPHSFPNFKFHNSTKDILSVAANLEISFLWKFSSTLQGIQFDITRVPQGPTLTFDVQSYSTLSSPPVYQSEVLTIFSGFDNSIQSKLSKQLFQSLFPSLDKSATPERILLVNYHNQQIQIRHYRFTGAENVSSLLLKLRQKQLNFASYENFEQLAAQTTSAPLVELGPRIDLTPVKAVNGVFDGVVLFNKFADKTAQEQQILAKKAQERVLLEGKRQKLVSKMLSEKQRKAKVEEDKKADNEAKNVAKVAMQGDQEGNKMGIKGKQVYEYVHKTRQERREVSDAKKKQQEEEVKMAKGKDGKIMKGRKVDKKMKRKGRE